MAVDFKQRIRGQRCWGDWGAEQGSFESDRGRIINSAAVRRLQQKTQVFPLERNAAVRSRLTHSMEVQQVGRHISQTIIKKLSEQNLLDEYGLAGLERQFESIVDMACLMHDIGNPPFGHFGEAAINQWFGNNISELLARADIRDSAETLDALKNDLCSFEGNAQGLRIVHTLQALNLTFSQMSGLLKYTRRGDQPKPENSYLQKKVGFYLSEAPLLTQLTEALAMSPGRRSPFAYVMEAADDISYCIADIEDAVEKGILRLSELPELLNRQYADLSKNYCVLPEQSGFMADITQKAMKSYEKSRLVGDFFIFLRVGINTQSVDYASNRFIENIGPIFDGSFDQALMEDNSGYHALLKTLKLVAIEHVFCHPEVEAQELQGYRIIAGLLDIYKPLLRLDRAVFDGLLAGQGNTPLYETRLFKKLSGKHIAAYKKAMDQLADFKTAFEQPSLSQASDNAWEFYFRCRLILDYISGMTDQFAYDEYRALHIIE